MSTSEPPPQDYVIRVALIQSESTVGEELNPSVWRRVKLSAHFKLDVLHDKVLAPLMGWTRNYHTYVFTKGTKKWLCENTSAPDLMHANFRSTVKMKDPADGTTLGDLLKKRGDVCLYTYDLGDGWYHKIELEQIIPKESSNGALEVLEGEMRCPDEDGEGCTTYQENVLNLVLKLRRNPHDNTTARQLAQNCFERRNALNVRGRFDPIEFSVEKTQEAIQKALASRASTMTGTKQFSSSQSMFGAGSWCPTTAGQRRLKTEMEDDRGGEGFHLQMMEAINLKPDDEHHTACSVCGNPLNLSVCGRCKMIYYCSVACQRKQWKQEKDGHKAVCEKEKANRIMCAREERDWTNNKPANLEMQGERIPLVKFHENLRYKVGDIVECSVGEEKWAEGVIVDTHYREPYWPQSQPSAPYQIRLVEENRALLRPEGAPGDLVSTGRLIFATWDDDIQIRKLPEDTKLSSSLAKLQMDIVD